MPIYGFECGSCGHRFDRLQKLSDPDPTVCPDCGAEQLRRQLTAPSFRLSGSGWYETDFKKDGDKKRNLTEKGDSASNSGETSSKPESANSEAKPASSESASNSKAGQPATSSDTAPVKPATKPDPKPAAKPAAE